MMNFSQKTERKILQTSNLNIIAMVVVVVVTEELFKPIAFFFKLRFLAKNGFRYLHLSMGHNFILLKDNCTKIGRLMQ